MQLITYARTIPIRFQWPIITFSITSPDIARHEEKNLSDYIIIWRDMCVWLPSHRSQCGSRSIFSDWEFRAIFPNSMIFCWLSTIHAANRFIIVILFRMFGRITEWPNTHALILELYIILFYFLTTNLWLHQFAGGKTIQCHFSVSKSKRKIENLILERSTIDCSQDYSYERWICRKENALDGSEIVICFSPTSPSLQPHHSTHQTFLSMRPSWNVKMCSRWMGWACSVVFVCVWFACGTQAIRGGQCCVHMWHLVCVFMRARAACVAVLVRIARAVYMKLRESIAHRVLRVCVCVFNLQKIRAANRWQQKRTVHDTGKWRRCYSDSDGVPVWIRFVLYGQRTLSLAAKTYSIETMHFYFSKKPSNLFRN